MVQVRKEDLVREEDRSDEGEGDCFFCQVYFDDGQIHKRHTNGHGKKLSRACKRCLNVQKGRTERARAQKELAKKRREAQTAAKQRAAAETKAAAYVFLPNSKS